MQHAASCESCARIAADLRYAEYRLALALADVKPSTPLDTLTDDAIAGSQRLRRRTAARLFRAALIAIAAVVAVTWFDVYIAHRGEDPTITKTVLLNCLVPVDAIEVATPWLRASGSAAYRNGSLKVITLRGRTAEVHAAGQAIAEMDFRCQLPGSGSNSSAGIPGKD
jgi:hypothetical protein